MSGHRQGKTNTKHSTEREIAAVQHALRSDKSGRSRMVQTAVSNVSTSEMVKKNDYPGKLWTVGHSKRSASDFIALLQGHGIQQLVDVRTIPRSRHNPQFNQDELAALLKEEGIHYLHMPALGGLRHGHRDSVNTGWRNASFRGYADYMQTAEFNLALKELIRLARNRSTAIMCAEAVPWRCHRSLIADALLVRGLHVEEISSATSTRPHLLTPWARVHGERITYPSDPVRPDPGEGRIDTQDCAVDA